jgi:hypothetical protein
MQREHRPPRLLIGGQQRALCGTDKAKAPAPFRSKRRSIMTAFRRG